MSVVADPPALRSRVRARAQTVRREIQALRALAVLGVLVFHLWPATFPGGFVGVDVFFVLSGFLITDHLLRELYTHGRVSLPQFWARRARRLLPAALLVLVVVAVATRLWVPDTRWAQFGSEILASTFYVENWALAAQSVDYMALSNVKSPVQHFWSLGVEEQFYLVWPILLGAAWWFAARRRRTGLTVVLATLSIVTAASLIYSIVLTSLAPTVAYFSTFTRAWEFGAGALLAVVTARGLQIRGRALTAGASWAGLGMIVASMMLFDGQTPFPSFTAALPVVGTILVIAAGMPGAPWGPGAIYGLRPVQFVGDVSYGTYLWHWPIVVLLPFARNAPNGILVSFAILFGSIALGWLSKTLVEDPFRTRSVIARARPRWSFAAVAAATAVIALAVTPLATYAIAAPADAGRAGPCYGAAAMGDVECAPVDEVPLTAAVSSFSADLPLGELLQCELSTNSKAFQKCDFGDADAPGPHVALLGDSHATRMAEPIRDLVAEKDGRFSTFLLSGCAAITTQTTGSAWGFDAEYAETCRSVSQDMIEQIEQDPSIDVVVMTNRSRLYVSDDPDRHPLTADMVAGTIRGFEDAGKRVIVLADPPERYAVPPRGGESAADCLSRVDDPSGCALSRAAAEFADPLRAGGLAAGADVVGLDDLFCSDTECMSRIGGVVVYSDDNHLTRSFALSLVPQLRERLAL
ncbi:acyltransferase [Microbacterium sp. P26]|uniref:acyltransferase family protein n=1 Tax=Microbacterium TaxID=33882 RepID=UPI00203D2423|nr:acyltransferase family protein [Microbacterium sp. P26]MCM3500742.1 acyltransferase [Microbacterium sp. P26]